MRGEHDEELEASNRGILERGWFLSLLAALGVLITVFLFFPHLVGVRSATRPGSLGLATTPAGPLRPPLPVPEPASTSPARDVTAGVPRMVPDSPTSRPREGAAETASAMPSRGEFWIQVGAFKQSKDAAGLAKRLTRDHYPVVVRRDASSAGGHVIWVGKYSSANRAEEVRASLERKGVRGVIVKATGP